MRYEPLKIGRELSQRLGSELEEHVPVRDISSFGVGGVADFFYTATSVHQLLTAVTTAASLAIPWTIIGSASQTIVADFGFGGLVIHNRARRLEYIRETGHVLAESGASWPQLVLGAANYDLGGLEPLLVMPGTVGGSVIQDRHTPEGITPRSFVRSLTLINDQLDVEHLTGKQFVKQQKRILAILVTNFQFVHTRRDEILRRIGHFERERRQYEGRGTTWLGPVFVSETAVADPTVLTHLFQRARVMGMRVGGAAFSIQRPNFVEARGRVTAREVRTLVNDVYTRLADVMIEPLESQLRFIGSWGDEN